MNNKNTYSGSTKKSYPEAGKKSGHVVAVKSSDKGQNLIRPLETMGNPYPVCQICKENLDILCLTVGR